MILNILIKLIDIIVPLIYFSVVIYMVQSEIYKGLVKDDIDYLLLKIIPPKKRKINNK